MSVCVCVSNIASVYTLISYQFINFVCINLAPYLFNLSLCCLLQPKREGGRERERPPQGAGSAAHSIFDLWILGMQLVGHFNGGCRRQRLPPPTPTLSLSPSLIVVALDYGYGSGLGLESNNNWGRIQLNILHIPNGIIFRSSIQERYYNNVTYDWKGIYNSKRLIRLEWEREQQQLLGMF